MQLTVLVNKLPNLQGNVILGGQKLIKTLHRENVSFRDRDLVKVGVNHGIFHVYHFEIFWFLIARGLGCIKRPSCQPLFLLLVLKCAICQENSLCKI